MYSCVQNLVISSAKVGWKKQGTCVLVDNESPPPKLDGYEADKGWKEVKNFMVSISIQVHTRAHAFQYQRTKTRHYLLE